MAHGGTNFGLTAGYNLITSYDYFSPINQQGIPTTKYHLFRSIYAGYSKTLIPAIPDTIPTMNLGLMEAKPISSLFDNLASP